MKKIFYLSALIALVFFFSGCDTFLENTEVINTENLGSGFVTEKNADEAILAIYPEIKNSNGLNGRNEDVLLDCYAAD